MFADLQGLAGLVRERSYWSEAWVAHTELLTRFATTLRASRAHPIVEVDDGWHAGRDVSVAVGRWGWLHVRMLIEEHDRGRCLVRTAAHLRLSAAGIVQVTALAVAVAAATAVSWLGPLAELAALGVLAGAIGQAARGTAMLERALRSVTVDAGMTPLPLAARSAAEETGTSQGAGPLGWFVPSSRPVLAATALVLLAALGVGGVSLGRGVTPDAASGGGVAVGIAGDVFVADARQGLIRRLRPRPPLGAAWTADDLGTDGHPLLGHEVPFDAAADIAVAPDGDLYVADARRHRISLVDRSTGRVVTVAGSGSAGFGGDGGPAAAAALRGPSAVAVGRDGNLYIADTLNHRVRAVSRATGVITTIAGDGQTASGAGVGDGGPAVQARLNRPSGLAVAPNGDVYVADTGHRRVRRIDAATGVITTVAGDGRAGSTGDGGPAVRASLAAPVGLALVSRGERLVVYVADVLDSRVRVFEPGGAIATLGRADRVLAPTRVAYHPAGWLYVKDASPDGVTAVAADSPAGLGRPAASAEASAPRAGPPLRTVLSPGSPGRSGRTVS
ncbi:MAG: hypothetical protein HY657_00775 [Acidobacteria bacterium]|nr:hypothetical protein [Acidobacteriota bacterium]